jgi:peptide deformylase
MTTVDTPVDLKLVPATEAVLRTPAADVADPRDVLPYVPAMQAAMEAQGGVGLAAPQVGLPLRFFVTNIKGHRVVINPKLVSVFGGRVSKSEGCLTWPGRTTFVARHKGIVVAWTDRAGTSRTSTLTDFDARIFQHEMDHLNGVCIFS